MARHFDTDAKRWWTLYDEHDDPVALGFAQRMMAVLEELQKECPPAPDRVVLDLGCGTGPYLGALASEPGKLIGIDVSPHMLLLAQKRAPSRIPRIGLVCGSATAMALKPGSCSAVLAAGVVEYFERPADVMRAIADALKPGGIAVVTAPHRWSAARMLGLPRTAPLWLGPRSKMAVLRALARIGVRRDPSTVYYGASFSRRAFRNLAAEAGLVAERIPLSGGIGARILGFPLMSGRVACGVASFIEARRRAWPWSLMGADLIAVLRKPTGS